MPLLIRLRTARSTMDVLHDLAADGAGDGTAVLAEEQTGARGSRGRTWSSPPGGLWLSVLLRPETAAGVELCGLRIGLAVARALEGLAPKMAIRIKWPNDLMVEDRKLGGILCEARWQGDSLAWVVAGIGVNVANAMPQELVGSAARLSEWLPGITPGVVEPEVTARVRTVSLGSEWFGPAELTELRRRDWLRGRRLAAPVPGTAIGISEEGTLLVRQQSGASVAVRAGTIELADRSLTP